MRTTQARGQAEAACNGRAVCAGRFGEAHPISSHRATALTPSSFGATSAGPGAPETAPGHSCSPLWLSPSVLVHWIASYPDFDVLDRPQPVTVGKGITAVQPSVQVSRTARFGDPKCPANPHCAAIFRGAWRPRLLRRRGRSRADAGRDRAVRRAILNPGHCPGPDRPERSRAAASRTTMTATLRLRTPDRRRDGEHDPSPGPGAVRAARKFPGQRNDGKCLRAGSAEAALDVVAGACVDR